MVRTVGDIVSEYSLRSCVRCGICDSVCPSGRNGGIYPESVLFSMLTADPSSDMPELRSAVWKCLMCHRCTMACPEGLDVTGAIRAMRYDSVSSGEPPKRFKMASDTLTECGRTFPVNDKVRQKREELGLNDIKEDAAAINELRIIMSRTGFLHE
ncbi:MAG: 4Fe-4S dicluster domain-containing protein [Methanomassiliicoccaceae archaeon]|nr:4Fe-4S dicluster domain-containing protein [Methanomassiliicoccaceae archaeon]